MDELIEALEKLIDASSIENVITSLADVCLLKAEHLRTNWQDKNTAEYWEKIANKLNKI